MSRLVSLQQVQDQPRIINRRQELLQWNNDFPPFRFNLMCIFSSCLIIGTRAATNPMSMVFDLPICELELQEAPLHCPSYHFLA
ncbi:hypothetical protein P692DRAFT_201788900 [Suillus brevipes Sb2]|nr:hypothetical protein P692DRAFT_201788900 [Suillus brevipes Sb2]